MIVRFAGLLGGIALALLLAACATPPQEPSRSTDSWAGRLSVRVESDPVQSFSAGFDLQGDARQGRLSLYSPLGATLAQLNWSPGEARLRADGKEQIFDSMDALTRRAVGAELPIEGLFSWLAGQPASPDGWIADLQNRNHGRLVARRFRPAPVVELRLVLD